MEVKELRIGSIVTHDDYSDEYFIVKSIDKTTEGGYIISTIGGKNGTWINSLELVGPIQITKEWLLKFGFEEKNDCFMEKNVPIKSGNTIFTLTHNYYDINHNYEDEIHCSLEVGEWTHNSEPESIFSIPYIKHVHQLQNLYFALTGEELTIKN